MQQKEATIYITRVRDGVRFPSYAREGDAGMDVESAVDLVIKPGETVVVPTGFSMAIPEGYEAQIRPRSGLSLKTMLRIPNSPGTIDSGYRDEVGIILHNASFLSVTDANEGTEASYTIDVKNNPHGAYLIRKGDRIAQMVIAKVATANFAEVPSVKEIGNDRGGGFGSTGTKN